MLYRSEKQQLRMPALKRRRTMNIVRLFGDSSAGAFLATEICGRRMPARRPLAPLRVNRRYQFSLTAS